MNTCTRHGFRHVWSVVLTFFYSSITEYWPTGLRTPLLTCYSNIFYEASDKKIYIFGKCFCFNGALIIGTCASCGMVLCFNVWIGLSGAAFELNWKFHQIFSNSVIHLKRKWFVFGVCYDSCAFGCKQFLRFFDAQRKSILQPFMYMSH